jgi:hypothetical protein
MRVTKEKINVTKAYISHMCRETPSGWIATEFCTFGDLPEVQNFMSIGEGV